MILKIVWLWRIVRYIIAYVLDLTLDNPLVMWYNYTCSMVLFFDDISGCTRVWRNWQTHQI